MSTTVVRIRRSKGQIVQDCDVYIGRALTMGGWNLKDSTFGNPFKVNIFGRDKALELYQNYIEKRLIEEEGFKEELLKLDGKVLGCFCKPDKCHGDILVEIIERLKK